MDNLKKQLDDFIEKVAIAIQALRLKEKEDKLEFLKQQMSAVDFWQDQQQAKMLTTEYHNLETVVSNWRQLEKNLTDLASLLQEKQAEELVDELEQNLLELQKIYDELKGQLYLQGKYDNLSAIITINAGAGGDDAQDWAQMLERMYLRFAEKQNWPVTYLSRSSGAEAGIKSATFKVNGLDAFGYLQAEAGVHRLVRLSPYDADHARHTSFAMVEVLPALPEAEVKIDPTELKIETYRSSGHGGQSVNTTDSAVRITHLPTGLSASCQNERSQQQNKSQALSYLYSKLQKYQESNREEERRALKGEYTEAAWGNQIRSYVLHPYKMVKDHRTNYQVSDPDKVLDGDIMEFIKARWQQQVTQ